MLAYRFHSLNKFLSATILKKDNKVPPSQTLHSKWARQILKKFEFPIVKKCHKEYKPENNGMIEHDMYRQERNTLDWFGIGLAEYTRKKKK